MKEDTIMKENKEDDVSIEYFDCECLSPEHTLRFILYDWDDETTLETEVFLHHHKYWHKRIWSAIKYIFGFKNNTFCGFMMRKEDIPRFKKLIKEYERRCQEYEQQK